MFLSEPTVITGTIVRGRSRVHVDEEFRKQVGDETVLSLRMWLSVYLSDISCPLCFMKVASPGDPIGA
jgi:hypothetical protein